MKKKKKEKQPIFDETMNTNIHEDHVQTSRDRTEVLFAVTSTVRISGVSPLAAEIILVDVRALVSSRFPVNADRTSTCVPQTPITTGDM